MTEGSIQSQLQYLREEEKLARDVYLTLYQRWELRIFDNIAGAEQRHMDRIGAVLAARQIPDPVTDDSVGVFQDASLGALYQELVQRGSNSALDALRVGALIEDLDLRDLDLLRGRVQEQDRDQDVLAAVDALACGSRNHLRAFARQLTNRGATYAPQYIAAERYASILATEHERCGRGHGGGGRGHGRDPGGGGHGRGGGGHGRGDCTQM